MSNLHVDSVKSIEELLAQARESVSAVVVIYIGAKWARVNAATRSFLTQTSARIPEATFFVLDEADCFPITDHFRVRTFPTTLVLKEGAVVDQMPGGNQAGLSRMIMRACGNNDASVAPPAASSSAMAHSSSSGGHGGARGDTEDEMLRRAIEESKRQAYAPSSGNTNSTSGDVEPAEVDAAKLAECLAAVKQVNAEEEAKKKAAEKAAKEAAEEAQRQLASFPAAAAAAADAEIPEPMESKFEKEGVQAQHERPSTLEGPESRSKIPSSAAAAVDGDSAERVKDTAVPPVEESLLAQLLSLEIPKKQATQAVRDSGASTVDAAMEWIVAHQERGLAAGSDSESAANGDASDTHTPAPASGDVPKAKSIRCTDTGKVGFFWMTSFVSRLLFIPDITVLLLSLNM